MHHKLQPIPHMETSMKIQMHTTHQLVAILYEPHLKHYDPPHSFLKEIFVWITFSWVMFLVAKLFNSHLPHFKVVVLPSLVQSLLPLSLMLLSWFFLVVTTLNPCIQKKIFPSKNNVIFHCITNCTNAPLRSTSFMNLDVSFKLCWNECNYHSKAIIDSI
jgi:hypothetical protein